MSTPYGRGVTPQHSIPYGPGESNPLMKSIPRPYKALMIMLGPLDTGKDGNRVPRGPRMGRRGYEDGRGAIADKRRFYKALYPHVNTSDKEWARQGRASAVNARMMRALSILCPHSEGDILRSIPTGPKTQ